MDSTTIKNVKKIKKNKKLKKNATRRKNKRVVGGDTPPVTGVEPEVNLTSETALQQQPPELLVTNPDPVVNPDSVINASDESGVSELQQQPPSEELQQLPVINADANTEVLSQPEGASINTEEVPSQPEGANTEVPSQPEGPSVNTEEVASQPESQSVNAEEVASQPEGINTEVPSQPESQSVNAEEVASEPQVANAEVPSEPEGANNLQQSSEVSPGDADLQQQKEVKEEDPVNKALLERANQILEITEQIKTETIKLKSDLLPEGTRTPAAAGGALKKRKKTFYKKYKSKISMKRRNKTVKNN